MEAGLEINIEQLFVDDANFHFSSPTGVSGLPVVFKCDEAVVGKLTEA